MGHSIDFRVVAYDQASRDFRKIGDEALLMAAKVRASDAEMGRSYDMVALKNHSMASRFSAMAKRMEKDADLSGNAADRMLKRIGNASDRIDQKLKGVWQRTNGWAKAVLALLPLFPPLVNAGLVLLGSLTSAVTLAGAGLGALGVAMLANFKTWKASSQAYKEAATAYQQFAQATKGITWTIYNDGARIFINLLKQGVPIVKSFGGVFHAWLQDIAQGMQGAEWARFLDFVKTFGAMDFSHLLNAVKNIVVGIGRIAVAFRTQGVAITKWLDDMTKKFADWAKSLDGKNALQGLMDYFRQNGPLLGSLIKNLGVAFAHLGQALAPLSHITLEALVHALEAFNRIPVGVIQKLAIAMGALRIALMGLRGLSAIVNTLASAQRRFAAANAAEATAADAAAASNGKLKNSAGGLKGILAGAGGRGGWVGAFALALMGLAASYDYAQKHSGYFRAEQGRMRTAVANAWSGIKSAVGPAVSWLQSKWQGIHNWNVKLGQDMSRWPSQVGRAFGSVGAAMAGAAAKIVSIYAKLESGWAKVLHALAHVPGFGWANTAAAHMDHAAARARALAASLNALHSRSITVRTDFITTHTNYQTTVYSSVGGGYNTSVHPKRGGGGRYATGGRPPLDRYSIVGENGPELFKPDVPGRIIPTHRAEAMGPRSASTADYALIAKAVAEALQGVTIYVELPDGRVIQQSLLRHKRRSGNVPLGLA